MIHHNLKPLVLVLLAASCAKDDPPPPQPARAAATEALQVAPPELPAPEPKYDADPAQLKRMRAALSDLQIVHATCSKPRERGLSQACMSQMREHKQKLERIEGSLEAIPKTAAGYFDLGMATSLADNCCNCSAGDARLCEKVATHLRKATLALGE